MAPAPPRSPARPSRRSFVEPAATGPERIAKLLARAGIASRREVERMIAEGRIALDGAVLESPAITLSSLANVTVDGKPVAAPEPTRLFLFHKPAGVLTTERDPRGRPTIYDRLPPGLPRLVPVGRLDLNTEGLLLMTTDGAFKRQLELPATGVERAYRARAYGSITQAQLESLIEGIEVEGVRYGPIDANLERRTGANVWIEMILTEGKNREVRRVLEYLGLSVSRLIRTRYGPFVLGDLEAGQVGEVRAADLASFRRSLARGKPATDPVRVSAPTPPSAAPRAAAPRPAASRAATTRPADARQNITRPVPVRTATPDRAGAARATGSRPVTARAADARPAAARPTAARAAPDRASSSEASARGRAPAKGRPQAPAPPKPEAKATGNARARRAAAFRSARGDDTPPPAPPTRPVRGKPAPSGAPRGPRRPTRRPN